MGCCCSEEAPSRDSRGDLWAFSAPPAATTAAVEPLPVRQTNYCASQNLVIVDDNISGAPIIKESFLFRQSPSWPYVMQKRWVTLKGRVLSYFEDKSSAVASGSIDLEGATIIDSPHNAKAPHAFGITGETATLVKGRVFIFAASTRDDYLQWLEVLQVATTKSA